MHCFYYVVHGQIYTNRWRIVVTIHIVEEYTTMLCIGILDERRTNAITSLAKKERLFPIGACCERLGYEFCGTFKLTEGLVEPSSVYSWNMLIGAMRGWSFRDY